MFSTEMISVPTGIIFLVSLGTLWRAQARFTAPMLFMCAFFFNFLIGGFTGVFLSDVPSDFTLHGSYFVQAHFHYTIMGSEVFALMAAIVYYLPKMTGRSMDTRLLKFQFWAVFLTFNGTFLSLVAVGILGMPRRVISYAQFLQPLNISASVFAFGLGASMALFLGILIWEAVLKGRPSTANPWESLGVEWQVPTPVPVFNFDKIPVAWSLPYEYDTGKPAAEFGPVSPVLGGASA
jgi:cytochrome c oxidase subunit 1